MTVLDPTGKVIFKSSGIIGNMTDYDRQISDRISRLERDRDLGEARFDKRLERLEDEVAMLKEKLEEKTKGGEE